MRMTERLKKAIRESGQSCSAISRGSGVTVPVITRFIRDEYDMKLASADKLASYLGLELTEKRGKGKKSNRPAAGNS